jgi:hypothetical protein
MFGKKKLSNKVPCPFCGATNLLGGVDVYSDLMTCKGTPQKRCGRLVPTGLEGEVRKVQEAWAGGPYRDYPKAAVARAIAFATGIYKLATHGRTIDYKAIEKQVRKKVTDAPVAVSSQVGGGIKRQLEVTVGAREMIVTDLGVGVLIVTVVGLSPAGQRWSQIYVVFRGSRGEGRNTNQNLAGWADFGGIGAKADIHNIDWLANIQNKVQVSPWWDAGVKVHEGFYKLYSGCMREVLDQVRDEYARAPAEAGPPQVIVTGHSLGAALATLCAHHLESETSFEPFCFTFNSPRAGGLKFVRDFNASIAHKKKGLLSEPSQVRTSGHSPFSGALPR